MIGFIEKIFTGDFELIDSRTIQVLEAEKTVLSFGDSNIEFSFESKDDSEPAIRVDSSEDKKIKFILTNVMQPSYGTTDFVPFGEVDDEKTVFISFRIYSLSDKRVRSLEYSIYKK
ncbi:MAG: hypothetical protein V4576_01740 [Patescibacteria group bacterium]